MLLGGFAVAQRPNTVGVPIHPSAARNLVIGSTLLLPSIRTLEEGAVLCALNLPGGVFCVGEGGGVP